MSPKSPFFFFLAGALGCLFWSGLTGADESHPGLSVESQYSEAVLAYNRKQTGEALQILDQIIAEHPDYTAALELKALTLKNQGDDRKAVDVYLDLIKLKPESERGPYYFEIGVVLYRVKNRARSKEYLERALGLRFNESACHLFLGMLAQEDSHFSEAEAHFHEVVQTGLPEMRVVAHYYLGVIYLKQGFGPGGTSELLKAKEKALLLPDNKIAADALVSVNRILEPFGKGQIFGNLTLSLKYDSNISELPTSVTAQPQASSTTTGQLVASGGVGYVSPSLETFQYVPSYQFMYNKNFNSTVKGFEYFSNIGSVFVNYKPLAETNGGIMLSGSYTFQNMPNDPANPNGSYTLSKYSLTGQLGPFVKTMVAPRIQAQAEFQLRPQDFYTQTFLSGTSYFARFSLTQTSSSPYYNPGVWVSLENDSTSGADFKYRSAAIGGFDVVHATEKDTATIGLDFTHYSYYASAAGRVDNTINPHLSWLHNLAEKWAIVGDMSYTTNSSSQAATYSYNRFEFGAGISRSL